MSGITESKFMVFIDNNAGSGFSVAIEFKIKAFEKYIHNKIMIFKI